MSEFPPPTPTSPSGSDMSPPIVPLSDPPPSGKPFWKKWWVIALAVVAVLGIIGALTGGRKDQESAVGTEPKTTGVTESSASIATANVSDVATTSVPEPASTTPATVTAATTPVPTTAAASTTTAPPVTTVPATTLPSIPGFGSGQQIVGSDVQPGVYITAGADGINCYWQRLSGLSGDFDEIITNGNAEGQVIVEISPTDVAFSSDGCHDWTAFLGGVPGDAMSDGDWAVGQQITAGRWSTAGDPTSSNCYWERASGFGHDFDEIITNNNTNGKTVVDIPATDVRFTTSGCGTWARIG
jgi:hypothetical protein